MSDESKAAQFEVPTEVVSTIAETLGFKSPVRKPSEPEEVIVEDSGPDELEEGVGTKRVTGHIVFSGFDSEVVGSIPQELKFRILATQTGSRIRLIVDLKL
jgi:hypothetical protein